jgi:hypothetical protein
VSNVVRNSFESRRAWLVAIVSLLADAVVGNGRAVAQTATLPHLDAGSPMARSLGYVVDAAVVNSKTEPTFKMGARCANCLQLQGKASEAWRPCTLFPGQLVSANGWCRVWVARPKT